MDITFFWSALCLLMKEILILNLIILKEKTCIKQLNYYGLITRRKLKKIPVYILTHTSNAKCFRNATLINIRGIAEIIVPFSGYGRHSSNQGMVD